MASPGGGTKVWCLLSEVYSRGDNQVTKTLNPEPLPLNPEP